MSFGSYALVARIGQGGMGEVWSARHPDLGRTVAIKLVKPGGDARETAERLVREARAAASLRSPHTIRIHDLGVSEDGSFYQVMELLEGYDLETLVEAWGPLRPLLGDEELPATEGDRGEQALLRGVRTPGLHVGHGLARDGLRDHRRRPVDRRGAVGGRRVGGTGDRHAHARTRR